MTLTAFQITSPAEPRFAALYDIYAQSLPAREQKKRPEVEALLSRPDYLVLTFEDEANVLSFAIVQFSRTEPIALLEYMATAPQSRGSGLGADVFHKVAQCIGSRTLVIEADSEREEGAHDLPLRIRRKNFYRRLGCRQLGGVAYILPLPGEGDPPLMDILIYRTAMPATVPADDVRRWLAAIYSEVYNKGRDDLRIDSMLSSLNGSVIPVL